MSVSEVTPQTNLKIHKCIILIQDLIKITEGFNKNWLNLRYEWTVQIYYTIEAKVCRCLFIFSCIFPIGNPICLPKKLVKHLAGGKSNPFRFSWAFCLTFSHDVSWSGLKHSLPFMPHREFSLSLLWEHCHQFYFCGSSLCFLLFLIGYWID